VSKATPSYLGSYRLLNVVNTGQTSQMWQAYHDGLQQFFAIKMLLEKYRKDREQIAYLKQEYAVGSKVVHERIIRVQEYSVERGIPFLALEWFSAPNMKVRVRQGLEAIGYMVPSIALGATEGLAHLGSQGWVHRDIKPDNFLVADDGAVKLIDFSLAVRCKGAWGKLLASKTKVQGTRSYMSPEQIRGGALDLRADVYSLACTLFELTSGRLPYTGTTTNDLLMKHLKATPPPLEAANPNVTPEFAQLIRRAMAKEPSARPKSAADFLIELRGIRVFRRDPPPPQETKKTAGPPVGPPKT
jgi:serine/threonine protein kinase